jgi:hypothetical protein
VISFIVCLVSVKAGSAEIVRLIRKIIGAVIMTLDKAKEMLEEEYEKAKTLEYIQNPLAYALFNVWRKADMQGRRGRPRKE